MFTLGVDFGTNSVRALVVRCSDGAEYGSRVVDYPSGAQGVLLDPKDGLLARQHPGDYLFGLEESIQGALAQAGRKPDFDPSNVIGIGVDSTGSSPIPVDDQNRPLASSAGGKIISTRNAGCGRITQAGARRRKSPNSAHKFGRSTSPNAAGSILQNGFGPRFGIVSMSLPKRSTLLTPGSNSPTGFRRVLAGVGDRWSSAAVCAAGHKAMYAEDWGGLPDKPFLEVLDPRLAEMSDRLYEMAYDARELAGPFCSEWAQVRAHPGYPIAIGEFDIITARSAAACRRHARQGDRHLDLRLRGRFRRQRSRGYSRHCGVVKGAILPGFIGLEAGESAVGDLFKWWVEVICEGGAELHAKLTDEAGKLRPGRPGLWRLDWNNGNRTMIVDQLLTGLLAGRHSTRREGDLSRADRSNGVRRARDHRAAARIRRAHRSHRLRRRHRRKEPAAHADLRRCNRLRNASGRFQPGLHAGLGDRRGRIRRRTSGFRWRKTEMTSLKPKKSRPQRRAPGNLRGALLALSRRARQFRRRAHFDRPFARDERLDRDQICATGMTARAPGSARRQFASIIGKLRRP